MYVANDVFTEGRMSGIKCYAPYCTVILQLRYECKSSCSNAQQQIVRFAMIEMQCNAVYATASASCSEH